MPQKKKLDTDPYIVGVLQEKKSISNSGDARTENGSKAQCLQVQNLKGYSKCHERALAPFIGDFDSSWVSFWLLFFVLFLVLMVFLFSSGVFGVCLFVFGTRAILLPVGQESGISSLSLYHCCLSSGCTSLCLPLLPLVQK